MDNRDDDDANDNSFYEVCIYLYPNDESKIASKQCPVCTYLNENLDETCIMCFSNLKVKSEIEAKYSDLFDCAICLEKNITSENKFVLKNCKHNFCKLIIFYLGL